jgi:hypothetical protein
MLGEEGGAIAAEVILDLVARPTLNTLARVHTWVTGSEVLILGPARAGKSSFSEYIQYGLLEPEQETATTILPHQTASFRLAIGKNSSLEMKVKRAVDVAGEIGPIEHARLAEERRPQAIVVVLDASAPLKGKAKNATAPWLTEFCKHLKQRVSENRKMKKRLRSLVFVANKCDKLANGSVEQRLAVYKQVIRAHMADEAFGPLRESEFVLPCILVRNPRGTELADAVVSRIARSLSK